MAAEGGRTAARAVRSSTYPTDADFSGGRLRILRFPRLSSWRSTSRSRRVVAVRVVLPIHVQAQGELRHVVGADGEARPPNGPNRLR